MKNNQIAKFYKFEAEEFLSFGNYKHALEKYNKCLLKAVHKSDIQSEAYAGRAKVYFLLNEFENCLDNIRQASDGNDHNGMRDMLSTYEVKCSQQSKSNGINGNDESFFKLSLPANKKIPFIADCLEISENDFYGRHIITNRDLNPGDIVLIEEPFYKVLNPIKCHTRCVICLKQNKLNLYPCEKCSYAMFCSKKCSESVIHQYECNVSHEENFQNMLLLRMIYQGIDINGSLDDLQKLIEEQNTKSTIMDFNFADPNHSMYNKERILAATGLVEREPNLPEAYAKYEKIIEKFQTTTKESKIFLQNYLLSCLKCMTVNFFHFFWSPDELDGHGFGLCLFACFFAHSCDPNVDKIDVDNKFSFVVNKKIKAGEQLVMSYDRYTYLTRSRNDRQNYFKLNYEFDCNCIACKNDFSELMNLDKLDSNFDGSKPCEDDKQASIEKYKKNCEYIESHMDRYPCYEVCFLMQQNIELLHIIGNW